MTRLRFYFEHSLIGYFVKRVKEKWFHPQLLPPSGKIDLYGVTLQVDCLPLVMQNIVLSGNYELPEIKILPALLASTDQVLEIGAAIGFLGLYCRKIVNVTNLVCVEPNPITLSYLRHNYAINGFIPTIVEAAMTATDGPVSFYVSDAFWCDSLTLRSDTCEPELITVEGLTFASLAQRIGIKFNVLIIDIEGGEEHLPLQSLPDHITKVLIEIHPEVIGIRKAYNVLENLIRSGFEVHGHYHNSWALKR